MRWVWWGAKNLCASVRGAATTGCATKSIGAHNMREHPFASLQISYVAMDCSAQSLSQQAKPIRPVDDLHSSYCRGNRASNIIRNSMRSHSAVVVLPEELLADKPSTVR